MRTALNTTLEISARENDSAAWEVRDMSKLASALLGTLYLLANVPALAQPASERTTPTSVTLTGEEWACLGTRLDNLLTSSSDKVRVPLSACGIGPGIRGPGASNPTVGAPNSAVGAPNSTVSRGPRSSPAPTSPAARSTTLTQAPLYLTKAQLTCVQSLLSSVTHDADHVSTIDLQSCKVSS